MNITNSSLIVKRSVKICISQVITFLQVVQIGLMGIPVLGRPTCILTLDGKLGLPLMIQICVFIR